MRTSQIHKYNYYQVHPMLSHTLCIVVYIYNITIHQYLQYFQLLTIFPATYDVVVDVICSISGELAALQCLHIASV